MEKEIFNDLANMISLLGGNPGIVEFVRNLDPGKPIDDSAAKMFKNYNNELITLAKHRLANVKGTKVTVG